MIPLSIANVRITDNEFYSRSQIEGKRQWNTFGMQILQLKMKITKFVCPPIALTHSLLSSCWLESAVTRFSMNVALLFLVFQNRSQNENILTEIVFFCFLSAAVLSREIIFSFSLTSAEEMVLSTL